MIEGLIAVATIVTFLAILYGASYFISEKMVKKRIFLDKKMLIKQETPENIQKMKNVAHAVCNNNIIRLELLENETYTVNTTVDHGTISDVMVENKHATVFVSNNGHEEVWQKGFSEKQAAKMNAVYLTGTLFTILLLGIFLLNGIK